MAAAFWLTLPLNASAQQALADLAGNGSVLLQSPAGEIVFSLNADMPLVPASLLKIPLAQAALTALGEDYRFETHFYQNARGDLLVRGLGDPFLVSEEIALIAKRLSQQRLKRIRRLVVDDSAFAQSLICRWRQALMTPTPLATVRWLSISTPSIWPGIPNSRSSAQNHKRP